jgi:hypothetical protein
VKRIALLSFALSATACGLFQLGSSATTTSATSTGGGAVSGTYCGTDATTGVTLCLGLSACPDILVDNAVFPACGFRVDGSALDVECLCGAYLCPLGSAASCDEVAALLADQYESEVCAQAAAGTCTEVGTSSSSSSSSSSSGASTCDTVCRSECAGDPTCYVACGC